MGDIRSVDFREGFSLGLHAMLPVLGLGASSRAPFADLIDFVRDHFGDFEKLIEIMRKPSRGFSESVQPYWPDNFKPRRGELDYYSASELGTLTWAGVKDTKRECERRLALIGGKSATLRLLAIADTRLRVIESLNLEAGGNIDDVWVRTTESQVEFMQVLAESQDDILTHRLLLVPRISVREGERHSDYDTFGYRDVIDMSRIIGRLEDAKSDSA